MSAGSPASPLVAEALNRSAQISRIILDASRSKDGSAKIDAVWQRLHSVNTQDPLSDRFEPSEPQENAPSSPQRSKDADFVATHALNSPERSTAGSLTNADWKKTRDLERATAESTPSSSPSRKSHTEHTHWHKNRRQNTELYLEDLSLGPIIEEQMSKFEFPSLEPEMEALVLRTERVVQATFGVGLQVSTEVPHAVQGADQAIPVGNSERNIEVGDVLVGVGGKLTEMTNIEVIESLICGEEKTTVALVLRSHRTEELYEINLLRHVRIRLSERNKCWYELKDGVNSLSVAPSIVQKLEEIRQNVCCYEDGPIDYLNEDKHGQTSLGFVLSVVPFSQSEARFFIQYVIPGTASDQDECLISGDELIAINGIQLSNLKEEAVLELLRGKGLVGSTCVLMIRRQDKVLQVEIVRLSKAFVSQSDQLFIELRLHLDLIERRASHHELRTSIERLTQVMHTMQRVRIREECVLANKLYVMQCRVIQNLTDAEKCLTATKRNSKETNHIANESGSKQKSKEFYLDEIENLKVEISQKTELIRLQSFELKKLRDRLELDVDTSLLSQENSKRQLFTSASETLKSSNICSQFLGRSVASDATSSQSRSVMERSSMANVQSHDDVKAVDPPTIAPKSGVYDGAVHIRITSETPNSTIYCTRDNSDPSPSNYAACGSSPLLIELQHSAVMKCVTVVGAKLSSEVISEKYVIAKTATAGIGILVESEAWNPEGEFVIKDIMVGGPASRSGSIQIGDVLHKIDDKPVRNLNLHQVLDLIKGAGGSIIKLEMTRTDSVRRMGGTKLFAVELRRAKLSPP